jgi:ABC-type bacteriocin/lantibiotic exporter with double-glycine peptidase domain
LEILLSNSENEIEVDDTVANSLSLKEIFFRFKWRILFTWVAVILEAITFLLFPLAMGYAIDSLIGESYTGLIVLAVLGGLSLFIGSARRYYDTRIYAGIYAETAPELVEKERARDTDVSTISARAGLISELVEFFENSIPEIVSSLIGLVGALGIIWYLNLQVFLACLVTTVLIVIVYALSSKRTYRLNSGYNQELEEQVKTLTNAKPPEVVAHFKRIARWNIRLSDLETGNFSVSWIVLIALLIYSIFAIIGNEVTSQGEVLAVLMYVFNYIEGVIMLPYFYQQLVRLQEISHRVK